MAARTVTGKVVDVKSRYEADSYSASRYAPHNEYYAYYLDITLELTDGMRVYFRSPKSVMSVANGGGAAVCTFRDCVWQDGVGYAFPDDHPWFRRVGQNAVATAERAADVGLAAKVAVGDVLTVRGSYEELVSRKGNRYGSMKRVKRLPE